MSDLISQIEESSHAQASAAPPETPLQLQLSAPRVGLDSAMWDITSPSGLVLRARKMCWGVRGPKGWRVTRCELSPAASISESQARQWVRAHAIYEIVTRTRAELFEILAQLWERDPLTSQWVAGDE